MMKISAFFHSASRLGMLILPAFIAACGGDRADTDIPNPAQARPHVTTDISACETGEGAPFLVFSQNDSGISATCTRAGFIDAANPFFKPFGNGRSCASCHLQENGWSVTPAGLLARFNETAGTDPVFHPLDAANAPTADVSTEEARRAAYSMLLSKGVIRIGLPIPDSAEFALVEVDDPYGYASIRELSLFRRPLPTSNLKFSATLMWDGRHTHKDNASNLCIEGTADCFATLEFSLGKQANAALLAHAEAEREFTPAEQNAIVHFQKRLFTAQIFDAKARSLTGAGARGGPLALSENMFYFGINDLHAGDYRTKAPFTPRAMTLYQAWNADPAALSDPDVPAEDAGKVAAARRAIARGQGLFNNRPIIINGVGGMRTASVRGTCTTCHNAPDTGSHSIPLMLNLGLADAARRTPDMPLYTLRNKETGETIQTTDPGAAMHTGKWQDIGRFKIPVLRGLAARPPYFHNGSARDLVEVVRFYDERFNIGMTAQEISDLAAFLNAL